ncbi:MAG: ThiF family adenylyltransferase [Bacillota bacterium]|nr:ThiF family adenylyltransferase [Bacillota bacterium]
MDRYARQEVIRGIGPEGQAKLKAGHVTIIGLGALGSVAANLLARAGIGHLRIVDRDYVELSNLQRQVLYDEDDAAQATPKAIAAADKLRLVNSEIEIEPVLADVNSGNIDHFIEDADVIIDATDNMEIRLLLDEACHSNQKPWIYGGALAACGMTMNLLPEDDAPCLHCLFGSAEPDGETCATAGVLGAMTSIIASIQCAEAIKILIGSPDVRRTLLSIDIWNNTWDELEIRKDPNCPLCGENRYEYYGKPAGAQSVSLCGRNAVQIVPQKEIETDFDTYAKNWSACGEVTRSKYMLDLDMGDHGIKLFRDGRAIVRGTSDIAKAKSIYALE